MPYPDDPKYIALLNDTNFGISDTSATIASTIEYTRDYADEMRILLTDSIANLNEIVGSYNPTIEDIDTSVSPIDAPVFPDSPYFPALDLEDSWPDGIGVAPVSMDYGDMSFDFVSPEAPAEISGNFDWLPAEYTSDMWLAVFTKVHEGILNGGSGLDPAVHSAIVERNREAGRTARERTYKSALDGVGESGFNVASGRIASMQTELAIDIIAKEQDENNNLLIKDFDMAVKNNEFMITTGVSIESTIRATFEASEQRSFETAKASKEFVVMVYDANIKAYVAKWEGVRNRLEALKLKVDAISSYNDGNIKVYLGKAEVYKTEIEAITAKNTGLVDARKGEVDTYSVEIEAVAKKYQLLVEEAKLNMDGTRLDIEKAIEESKLQLQAYSDKAHLSEKIAESTSQIASQSVASALGAIQTSVGQSYQSGEKRSESYTHYQSLSESHSYEEDTPTLA